jgi:sialic acid synthase SpsE
MQTMLGDGEKKITSSEKKNIKFARKSIIANKDISKGEKFTIKNITTKRASNGISAIKWKSILGKKAKKKYYIDEII